MSDVVIALNITTKNLKRFLSSNYTINTTPQPILVTAPSEVLDIFYSSKTFISGSVTTFVWTVTDLDTGYIYANGSDTDLVFNAGLGGVYHYRMLPNSSFEVHTTVNAGVFNIKMMGVSVINSP